MEFVNYEDTAQRCLLFQDITFPSAIRECDITLPFVIDRSVDLSQRNSEGKRLAKLAEVVNLFSFLGFVAAARMRPCFCSAICRLVSGTTFILKHGITRLFTPPFNPRRRC